MQVVEVLWLKGQGFFAPSLKEPSGGALGLGGRKVGPHHRAQAGLLPQLRHLERRDHKRGSPANKARSSRARCRRPNQRRHFKHRGRFLGLSEWSARRRGLRKGPRTTSTCALPRALHFAGLEAGLRHQEAAPPQHDQPRAPCRQTKVAVLHALMQAELTRPRVPQRTVFGTALAPMSTTVEAKAKTVMASAQHVAG